MPAANSANQRVHAITFRFLPSVSSNRVCRFLTMSISKMCSTTHKHTETTHRAYHHQPMHLRIRLIMAVAFHLHSIVELYPTNSYEKSLTFRTKLFIFENIIIKTSILQSGLIDFLCVADFVAHTPMSRPSPKFDLPSPTPGPLISSENNVTDERRNQLSEPFSTNTVTELGFYGRRRQNDIFLSFLLRWRR